MFIAFPTIETWENIKVLFDYVTSFCLCCTLISIYFWIIFPSKLHPSLEAQLQGTTQDHLQIFNIEMKAKMKSYQMPEQVTVMHEYTNTIKRWLMMKTLLIHVECSNFMCRWSFGSGLPPSCWVL